MAYPDVIAGIRAALDALGLTYLHLTVDFASKQMPAFLIYANGGSERFPFREDRVTVETYADGSTAARREAEKARELLTTSLIDVNGEPLDSIEVDTVPHEVPQYEGQPAMVTATYRVSTHAI